MNKIDESNFSSPNSDNDINLKGIIVGNGCTDWTKDTMPAMIDMLYEHHFLSMEEYQNYTKGCSSVQNLPKSLYENSGQDLP